MQTLYHADDISLYSNAFGFLRAPLSFEPDQSDADVIITGVPLMLLPPAVLAAATVHRLSVRHQ